MKILSLDEIPEEWKEQLDPNGLGRYGLFIEELSRTQIISAGSSKLAMDILVGIQGENFPYKDLKIGEPTIPHWKKLNRAMHMGVLVQDGDGVVQLIEGILDETFAPPNLSTSMPNITL